MANYWLRDCLFSRTADTSFTIKSTNAADTPSAYWEIVQY